MKEVHRTLAGNYASAGARLRVRCPSCLPALLGPGDWAVLRFSGDGGGAVGDRG